MKESAPRVIIIPPKPEAARSKTIKRQLRAAAYCRVSTDDEEQLSSYEAQKSHYEDKILSNPNWELAGIFADEGITGTSARKRPEFLRMIRMCKQKKIDVVLTKSISRFARNTVDCLNYIRVLRELGIAVIFEKENINTLDADSELLITLMGAFAQAESESISANIKWGKRQAMREGRASVRFDNMYGFKKEKNGTVVIIPEQAEVINKMIYEPLLAGASIGAIKKMLEARQVPNTDGSCRWGEAQIRRILTNEKYCGDVLFQKTYVQDCISGKTVQNTGQLPMYYIKDNHPAIVTRELQDAVREEFARRTALRSPSKKNSPTGRGRYSSRYSLTERLVCGECGTRFRRCVWIRGGKKLPVWRCVNRFDNGPKYCQSPAIYEESLQKAILNAINSLMSDKMSLREQVAQAMQKELMIIPNSTLTIGDIDRRLKKLEETFNKLLETAAEQTDSLSDTDEFKRISDEISKLKKKKAIMEEDIKSNAIIQRRIKNAVSSIADVSPEITEWSETLIRQLVDTVVVISTDLIKVKLRGGTEITVPLDNDWRKLI